MTYLVETFQMYTMHQILFLVGFPPLRSFHYLYLILFGVSVNTQAFISVRTLLLILVLKEIGQLHSLNHYVSMY